MKTCKQCGSVAFDDMEMCFECMSYFADTIDDVSSNDEYAVARLQVVLAGLFSYELYLNKLEGRSLSIGSASENAIVIPSEQVAPRHLEVYYTHGDIWVESMDVSYAAQVDELPLSGPVCVKPGMGIVLGEARITVLED